MKGSCVTQQDMSSTCATQQGMSSTFMSIILIVITVIIPSCSFPLRRVGVEKRVTQHNGQSRDLVLCWVVQIRTRTMKWHCNLPGDNLVHTSSVLKNVTRDNRGVGITYRQQPACSCQHRQHEDHISALSREVGLHLVHTFEQFHDHLLLCFMDIIDTDNASHRNPLSRQFQSEIDRHPSSGHSQSDTISQIHNLTENLAHKHNLTEDLAHNHNLTEDLAHRNPTSKKSQSDTMSRIHRLHSDLKSMDRLLFDRHKEIVENHLQQHDEVLWFSSEYVHRHRSRSQPPELSRLGRQQHAGIQTHMADARQSKSVVDTGQPKSVVDKGQPKSVVDSGQPKSVLDSGQPKSVVGSGQQKSLVDSGQPKSVLDSGQPKSVVGSGQQKSLVDSGQPKSVVDSGQPLDYNHSLLVLKNSVTMSDAESHVHTEDGSSSVKKFVQPDTSWVDDLRQMEVYSLDQSPTQNQLTQSNDTSLHQQKFTPKSFSFLYKRSPDLTFNDPKFPKQWHLVNQLTRNMDLNVTGVWRHNYTGYGVTVAVVDDGLEWMNPDLQANYNHEGSWDMNDNDPDPSPSASKLSNHHGTRCAGEIAAVANNYICGVGVAYKAQVSGVRVLDGLMTDSMEADAFNMKMDVNDIYSCSWGPDDDGRTLDGPHLMAAKALKHGVDFGRRGYGSIYVLASGNGGENWDNCNFDGYANSIYTVTVGAVDDKGTMPYYAEECASMLGVTFSSGTTNKRDIVTTDWTVGDSGGCTERHTGTSAAAPLAAAMIALMLQARPCLSWRDVQYIIILTAQMVDAHFAHSQRNGAGLSHSHKHGFGLLNSWRLVNAARVWQAVPWLTSYSYAKFDLNLVIPKGKDGPLRVAHVVSDTDIQGLSLFILENVQLTLTLSHPCRGKIGIILTSPSGTVSILAAPRPRDNSTEGFNDWTFTSVRCWGETPTGNWTFNVTDHDDALFGEGKVTKWRLTLFGTSMSSHEFADRRKLVESAMTGSFLDASPAPCPAAPKYDPVTGPVSDKILKVLILCGAFCFVMAMYETFEYMFCYNDEKQETARNRRLMDRAQELTSTTGALDNGGHDLVHMSNGTFPHGGLPAYNVADDGQDDDEDDIVDASETSRLLIGDTRCPSQPGVRGQLAEDIPLSTFRVESGQHSLSGYLPLPLATAADNGTDAALNNNPDHIIDKPATFVTSDNITR